jgi:hypothetical protein
MHDLERLKKGLCFGVYNALDVRLQAPIVTMVSCKSGYEPVADLVSNICEGNCFTTSQSHTGYEPVADLVSN